MQRTSAATVRPTAPPRRRILHVDLDPFFVAVERAADPSLRGQPVVVGGQPDGSGIVAAASSEARARGVRPGQSIAEARRLCPDAAFRPGDLEHYASVSDEVTAVLLEASRRVERPSADEAYVDLTPDDGRAAGPVKAAERIKDELQRRLGLDASLGLASSRLAARVASSWARPRGLLVVLPGYESSYLASQPVSFLSDLPPHLEAALHRIGIDTLGALAAADPAVLDEAVGPAAAARLQAAGRGEGEEPVAVAAPPLWVREDALLRQPRAEAEALLDGLAALAHRAGRRLMPFGLAAGVLTVEVRRGHAEQRRDETLETPVEDPEALAEAARRLAAPLVTPAHTVRSLHVRLSRLARTDRQRPLFPRASV